MGQLANVDRRAVTWGVVAVLVALAITVLGSGNLRWFDAALVGYLFGTLFAIFAVVYRYRMWLSRPPTARLNRRGWEAFRQPGRRGHNAAARRARLDHVPPARHLCGARPRRCVHLLVTPMRDPGALAVERSNDFLPLAGLLLLVVQGFVINRLARIPYPLWRPAPPPPS